MIQIRNITKGQANQTTVVVHPKIDDSVGYFASFTLSPGTHVEFPQTVLRTFSDMARHQLAGYAANGILKVYTIDSMHLYQDKGNNCTYAYDYLINAPDALALAHALSVAASLDTVLDAHFTNLAVHKVATAVIGGVVPTDLATLLVWIGLAQTAYETNHRPSVPAHDHLDGVNTLVPIAAVNLPTAIQALQELHRAYHSHKLWFNNAVELSTAAILTYT